MLLEPILHFKPLPQAVVVEEDLHLEVLSEDQEDQVVELLNLILEDQVMLEVTHHQKEIQEHLDLHLAVVVKVAAAEAAAQEDQVVLEHLLKLALADKVQHHQLQDHQ
jgi:hypothetical protein